MDGNTVETWNGYLWNVSPGRWLHTDWEGLRSLLFCSWLSKRYSRSPVLALIIDNEMEMMWIKAVVADLNLLTPNDPYRGRTAPLTSKVAFYKFIQQI